MKMLFFLLLIILVYNVVTAQNVGIGTTTPTEKLQVTGNIKADTIKPNGIKLTPNAGNGKVLISDAAGVGTWQASSVLAGAGNIGYGYGAIVLPMEIYPNIRLLQMPPVPQGTGLESAYPSLVTMPLWGLIRMMLVQIQTRARPAFTSGMAAVGC
jgi:hypothetical protein